MKDNFINNQKQFVICDKIAIKDRGKIDLICLKSIVKFESDKNYTIIYLKCGRKITSSRTLQVFEQLLEGKTEFLRVNRSEIINLNYVYMDNSGLKILEKRNNIKVSRRRGLSVANRILNFSNALSL